MKKHDLINSLLQLVFAYFLILSFIFVPSFMSCRSETVETKAMYSTTAPLQQPPAVILPIFDTSYVPVAWGSVLKIYPKITSEGNHKTYGHYWFTAAYGDNKILPVNYVQSGPIKTIDFADSVRVSDSSLFYICRRVIK